MIWYVIYKKKKFGIEAKKDNTPDWMQCKLQLNKETKRFEPVKNGNLSKVKQMNGMINTMI